MSTVTLQPSKKALRYNHIVGTGGIGSGIFFLLEGNHILGRNESRMGKLESHRDFCKQHIIMHYVSVLLGASKAGFFQSFPIGQIGNDDRGHRLRAMMEEVGMDTTYVKVKNDGTTLFSVCYQYPDHSGGNVTSSNSASNLVLPSDIDDFFAKYTQAGKEGIAMAAPEVPLSTRIRLLEHGNICGMLNIASILTSEVEEFEQLKGFELTNLLFVNIDEAQRIGGLDGAGHDVSELVASCTSRLQKINPKLLVLITDGANGSYCYQNGKIEFTPSLPARVESTAGAGDAFLSGTIVGLCCGLPMFKGFSSKYLNEAPLRTAIELGTVLASYSVTSPDTIHQGINAFTLGEYLRKSNLLMSKEFEKLFL